MSGTLIPTYKQSITGIKKIRMTHVSGSVTCNKNAKLDSNFGCKGIGIAVEFVLNGKIVAPNFSMGAQKSNNAKKNG